MVSVVGDETSNWGLIQAVAGTAIMMLLFSVSAIGASIIEEKNKGVAQVTAKPSTCIQPAEWKTDLRHDHCTFSARGHVSVCLDGVRLACWHESARLDTYDRCNCTMLFILWCIAGFCC